MAEVKIDIPGIGEVVAQNAASEQTLKELLNVMSGRSKGAAGPGGAVGGGVGGASLKTKKAQEGLDDVGESAYSASGALSKIANAGMGLVSGTFNMLMSTVTGTIGGLANLGAEALQGSVRISDYGRHIPVLGQVLTALDAQLDTFRELSSAGASFGNDMFDLSVVAGKSAIPIQDFTQLIGDNSAALRRFGGTVSEGVQTFGRLAKEMRQSGIGQQLMGMGFTTKELNENLINYNEMMLYMGKKEFMTDQQLIAGAQAYSFELDRIAKMTGRSRKEIEQEMNSRKDNVFLQAAMSTLDPEQIKRFNGAMRLLPPGMEGFEDALVDMVDGDPFTPLARGFSAMSETFRNKAENIKDMSPEEITQFYKDVEGDIRKYMEEHGKQGEQYVRALADGNPEIFAMFENMAKLKGITGTSAEVAKKEQDARDELTTKMGTAEEGIASALGAIKAEFLESKMFGDFKKMVADTIPSVEDFNTMAKEAMAYWNDKIFPEIKKIFDWYQDPQGGGKIKDDIKKFINTTINEITPKVKEMVDGVYDLFKDLQTEEGREKIWKRITGALSDGVGGLFENFDWLAFGGTLLLALTKLNPFGVLASTLIAGIVGFIGWDNIKQFFSIENLQQGVGKAVQTMINGVLDFFAIDIQLPNFSDFLPTWLGGKGRPLGDLFKGETYDKVPKVDEEKAQEEQEAKKKETETVDSTGKTDEKTKTSNEVTEQLVLLNKNIRDLMDINKRHLKATQSQSETV